MFKAVQTETEFPCEKDSQEVFKGIVETIPSRSHDESHLIDLVRDCDAFLSIYTLAKVTRKIIEAGKKLKVIGRYGVGVDNIDVSAATENGVAVVNCPVYHIPSVPEHILALVFALARRIPAADRSVRQGKWDHQQFVGMEIEGKTLSILGLGRIGSTLAKKAAGLGMTVLGYDPYVTAGSSELPGLRVVNFDQAVAEADFLAVSMPLTDETRNSIGEKIFSRMKKTAYLVNTARGPIVDENALYSALKGGRIAGAAMDVMATEPPGLNHKLYEFDNVIITPHTGGSTKESFARLGGLVARDVVSVLQGKMPRYLFNPRVLDKLKLD
jgi:D-3-phosphoglycerate dehydrogenase / 2-oxoglutarate reductase